jgi:tetratricopeptide (TPR) repeat protein
MRARSQRGSSSCSPRSTQMATALEKAIADEKWQSARSIIEGELRREPRNHWLLSRLALTYYEERKYEEALVVDEKARALAPDCPLVLWGCAGALSMLDRDQEAIVVYEQILSRGIAALATEKCGEGFARARGLYADVLYRIALCYEGLEDHECAGLFAQSSLKERGSGCESIYPIAKIQALAQRVQRRRA